MTKRLAIIPARGGSKRIPNKNIRDFCGKPIIGHILQAAKESELFDNIHVSTEDMQIMTVVTRLGFPPDFPRPESLSDDHTPIIPVLQYVAAEYLNRGQEFDQIWLLMSCAPLVSAFHLKEAAALFDQGGGSDALLAISEYPAPIEWAFSRRQDGGLVPVQEGLFAVRSQDLEKKYFDAGCFAVFPASRVFRARGAGSDEGFMGYLLPKSIAIDIDEEQDWKMAEAIFRSK
jgi:pseudaminic acid cytidylyltransferase